jgi:subtilisin family serine protease
VCGIVAQFSAAQVYSHRVLEADGTVDEFSVGEAIRMAIEDEHADVINLSLGTYTANDQPPWGFGLWSPQTEEVTTPIFVAAAGNSNWARPFWPACDNSKVISVGAVALNGASVVKAGFSNWGSWVWHCATGNAVLGVFGAKYCVSDLGTTGPYEGWALWSGTSFATPYVSAVVASFLAANPGSDLQAVQNALKGPPNVSSSLGGPATAGQVIEGVAHSGHLEPVGHYVP